MDLSFQNCLSNFSPNVEWAWRGSHNQKAWSKQGLFCKSNFPCSLKVLKVSGSPTTSISGGNCGVFTSVSQNKTRNLSAYGQTRSSQPWMTYQEHGFRSSFHQEIMASLWQLPCKNVFQLVSFSRYPCLEQKVQVLNYPSQVLFLEQTQCIAVKGGENGGPRSIYYHLQYSAVQY